MRRRNAASESRLARRYEPQNRMTAQSMTIVLAPNLVRPAAMPLKRPRLCSSRGCACAHHAAAPVLTTRCTYAQRLGRFS